MRRIRVDYSATSVEDSRSSALAGRQRPLRPNRGRSPRSLRTCRVVGFRGTGNGQNVGDQRPRLPRDLFWRACHVLLRAITPCTTAQHARLVISHVLHWGGGRKTAIKIHRFVSPPCRRGGMFFIMSATVAFWHKIDQGEERSQSLYGPKFRVSRKVTCLCEACGATTRPNEAETRQLDGPFVD